MAQRKKKPKLIAIVDADSLLYESASTFETVYDFGPDNQVVEIDEDGAKKHLDRTIKKIVKAMGCTEYKLFVTGPTNFRYDVLPTYKHNRSKTQKPVMVDMLKDYVLENHPCTKTSKIEADDACTILMSRHKGKYILGHIDKDLNQVEGLHYNWRTDETYEITYEEGQRFFYKQILQGDSTDGYGGCHLIGGEKADDILNGIQRKGKGEEQYIVQNDGYVGCEAYEHTLKSGKRKGETEVRWNVVWMDDVWDAIVSHYLKANFNNGTLESHTDVEGAEKLALVQARVARMLRAEEWIDNEVKLWEYSPTDIDLRKGESE